MAAIYLTHPVHGAKVAVLDMEADFDVQNGWSRYNPDEQNVPQIEVAPATRRGRRSKVETPDEGE
jgi:hypothetical protein